MAEAPHPDTWLSTNLAAAPSERLPGVLLAALGTASADPERAVAAWESIPRHRFEEILATDAAATTLALGALTEQGWERRLANRFADLAEYQCFGRIVNAAAGGAPVHVDLVGRLILHAYPTGVLNEPPAASRWFDHEIAEPVPCDLALDVAAAYPELVTAPERRIALAHVIEDRGRPGDIHNAEALVTSLSYEERIAAIDEQLRALLVVPKKRDLVGVMRVLATLDEAHKLEAAAAWLDRGPVHQHVATKLLKLIPRERLVLPERSTFQHESDPEAVNTLLKWLARDVDPSRHTDLVIGLAMTSPRAEVQRSARQWLEDLYGADLANAPVDVRDYLVSHPTGSIRVVPLPTRSAVAAEPTLPSAADGLSAGR